MNQENITMHLQANPKAPQRESGSAYIITLMVLFILTVLGISLMMVTQNEVVLGSTERTAQRVFYAAESGVHVAVSRILSREYFKETRYEMLNARRGNNPGFDKSQVIDVREQVTVPCVRQILDRPCDGCEIGGKNEWRAIDYRITSEGMRTGIAAGSTTDEADRIPMAKRSVTAMVQLSPKQLTSEFVNADCEVVQQNEWSDSLGG